MAELAFLNAGDLDAFQKRVLDESVFDDLGAGVAAAKFDSSTWSPETRAGSAFLQAFLGAALGQYARQDAQKQTAKVAAALPTLLSDPRGAAAPEGVNSTAFEALRGSAILKDSQRQTQAKLEADELRRQLMKDLLLEEGRAMYGAIAQRPKQAAGIRAAFSGEEAAPATASAAETPTIAARPLGLEDKIAQTAQRLIEDGSPPGAALETARAIYAADKNALESARKRIEGIRDAANSAKQVADVASVAMEGAGVTGQTGVGDLASWMWSGISKEERDQRAAQAQLDSLAPEIMKSARFPGMGALSDRETAMLLGSGPGSGKTKEENAAILEVMRSIAAANEEYADFLEDYVARNQTTQGAQVLWNAYKNAHPLVAAGSDGKVAFNSNRMSWRDYLAAPSGSTSSGVVAPAGMRVVRNRKTGETRIVPQ